MLQISPEKVAHIILYAREIDANYGGFSEGEADGDSAVADLREFIANLNEDEKASLVALMWIGRETFGADELDEAIETARAEATAPTEDYLTGVPLLADYLEGGLSELGISLEDIE
jgi:hypothetical protein